MALLVLLTAIVIAVGVLGTVLPIVPGLWLIWFACLVFGLIDGFDATAWVAMTVITVAAIAGTAAGVYLPQRTVAAGGLSVPAQLFALALGVVGFFAIPVIGAVLGFVGGVFVAALAQERDVPVAWRSTVAALRGIAIGSAVQFGAGMAMAIVWIAWVAV